MDELPQSEEIYEEEVEIAYSAFCPLLILMVGILLWIGYQVWSVNSQRVAMDQQFQSVSQQVVLAQNAKSKLYSVAQDLIQLSSKDTNAAAIVREANIRVTEPASTAPAK